MFISITADPLPAFMMAISGLPVSSLRPILCSFVRLFVLFFLILLFNKHVLNACLNTFSEMCALVGFQVFLFLKGE